MVRLQRINAEWQCPVIVAAPGPSLDPAVAWRVRKARWFDGWRIVAVNDAYRLIPHADALYACDGRWWVAHCGAPAFTGERWSTHRAGPCQTNDKAALPDFGIQFVAGRDGDTFSTDPNVIHYGSNSGFQAINLALLKGATRIVLVGFDMRVVGGRRHFFGDHPEPLNAPTDYGQFRRAFRIAARHCRTPIVNATPASALDAFPRMTLDDALTTAVARSDDLLRRDGTELDARAGAGGAG